MKVVEVLGPGCAKCQYTERVVREVVEASGVPAEIRYVTEYGEIAARGVMSTPAITVDGKLVLAGRVPTREQLRTWLGVA